MFTCMDKGVRAATGDGRKHQATMRTAVWQKSRNNPRKLIGAFDKSIGNARLGWRVSGVVNHHDFDLWPDTLEFPSVPNGALEIEPSDYYDSWDFRQHTGIMQEDAVIQKLLMADIVRYNTGEC